MSNLLAPLTFVVCPFAQLCLPPFKAYAFSEQRDKGRGSSRFSACFPIAPCLRQPHKISVWFCRFSPPLRSCWTFFVNGAFSPPRCEFSPPPPKSGIHLLISPTSFTKRAELFSYFFTCYIHTGWDEAGIHLFFSQQWKIVLTVPLIRNWILAPKLTAFFPIDCFSGLSPLCSAGKINGAPARGAPFFLNLLILLSLDTERGWCFISPPRLVATFL